MKPYTEPVTLNYGKLVTKIYVDIRIFLQCSDAAVDTGARKMFGRTRKVVFEKAGPEICEGPVRFSLQYDCY